MPDIDTALNALAARLPEYQKFVRYYEGDHDLAFATEKFNSAFAGRFSAFADNLSARVVDAVADRLKVTGFGVEEGGDSSITALAQQVWDFNRMDQRAGEVHTEALTTGDAYVIVWPDDKGNPILYPNDADIVTVKHDMEHPGVVLWAAKLWREDDGSYRLNMYYPDRLEKYVTKAGRTEGPSKADNFDEYKETETEPWPFVYPWGAGVVPVFPFSANSKIGRAGRSEMKQVIPLQDALNKSVADMMVAMEFAALPQRWIAGVEFEIDELTGEPKNYLKMAVDRVWAFLNEKTTTGQFPAADLSQFITVQEKFRAEIARVSATPMHYFMLESGSWPSGEALKTAEAPFVAKVEDRQTSFGNSWENVMQFAIYLIQKAAVRLSTQWVDAESRSETAHTTDVIAKLEAGIIDVTQAAKELNYSEKDIQAMLDRKTAQDAAATAARQQAVKDAQAMLAAQGVQQPDMVGGMAQ